VNLERITPGTSKDQIDGVTVIWIATDPTLTGSNRERIIGWYKDATVLRVSAADPTGQRWTDETTGEYCDYNVVAEKRNACLLPPFRRKHSVPRGKGGMGQANVRYPYDVNGVLSKASWMRQAISYVETYNAENLLTDPLAELPSAAQASREIAAGYESNPDIRKAVEERAMQVVEQFYSKDGFQVEDTSETQCYDFCCTKGKTQRLVEVKGTRTEGTAVLFTYNEVKLASDPNTNVDLCVVHSIKVKEGKDIRANGGVLVRYEKWNPEDHELRPVHYECRLLQRIGSAA
jgi:hypothetical protein